MLSRVQAGVKEIQEGPKPTEVGPDFMGVSVVAAVAPRRLLITTSDASANRCRWAGARTGDVRATMRGRPSSSWWNVREGCWCDYFRLPRMTRQWMVEHFASTAGHVSSEMRLSAQNSLCVCIRLHHAEKISFRVFAVREIPHTGNRRLRRNQFSARLPHRRDGRVHGVHTDRVRCRGHVSALQHSAINSWRSFRTRVYHPVLQGAVPLVESPPEHFLIERRRTIGFGRRNFKMYDASHILPPELN